MSGSAPTRRCSRCGPGANAQTPSLCLDDFEGKECHLALDLASRTDLAALAIVFPKQDPETGKTLYTAFARCYVNDAAVMEARNPSYPGWAAEGYLVITPGNETDFGTIEDDILDLCRRFKVLSVAYDPWAATQLAQRLSAERVPVIEFRANTQNFSRADQGAGRGDARGPHRA